MALNTGTHTGSDVKAAVERLFGDESGVQLTSGDLLRWINEAVTEIAMTNKILRAVSTTDYVAGTSTYTVPTPAAIQIESVRVGGIPIRGITITEYEQQVTADVLNATAERLPQFWHEYAGQLVFWPPPRDTLVGGLQILYVKAPEPLDSLGTIIPLPDKYYQAILNLVLSKAYEMDENYEAVVLKQQQVQNDLMRFKDEESVSQHRTYGTIQDVEDY